MSIPSIPIPPFSLPSGSSLVDSMDAAHSTDQVMQIMLAGWLAGLDQMQEANAEEIRAEQRSGSQSIQDASNVASAYPTLVQPQNVITNTAPVTTAENASSAQNGNISGITADTAKQFAAMYAYLMTHALRNMSGNKPMGSNTLDSWMELGSQRAISLLTFMAASDTAESQQAQEEIDSGAVTALEKFKQEQLDAGLKLAHTWLESVQKLGEELEKLDEKKALRAVQAYMNEAKGNPALLDASHVQTIVAVTALALLVSAGPSPILTRPDMVNATSQFSMVEAAVMNPAVMQVDTSAAVAMIAALMAQVAQAQVLLVQIAEKPALDAKKVSETFALENAKKILGFIEDRGYNVFLKTLVENMIGKENLERNLALVKINMLLTSLWLISRAETDGVKFVEIMMVLREYLSKDPKDTKKLPFPEGDMRYKLLAKIKEQIDGFGAAGAADLEEGLLRMMRFMEGKGQDGDLSEVTDPKKMVGFLNTPVDASQA